MPRIPSWPYASSTALTRAAQPRDEQGTASTRGGRRQGKPAYAPIPAARRRGKPLSAPTLAARRRGKPAYAPARGARLRDERGFTLVELMVTLVVLIIVFSAVLTMLAIAFDNQTTTQNRVTQLQQAMLGESQLVRELRQATALTITNSSSITYTEPITSGTASVTVSCSTSTGTCTRTASGSSQTLISNVVNSDIFTGSPGSSNPTYVTVKLVISAPGRASVTLTDGVNLRNVTLGT